MTDRPGYPWSDGDALFASELNAAIANASGSGTNVNDYGAMGDGVTDDTAALQAAANAIPPTGGALLFPAGNYIISAPVALKSGTIVQGAGATISAAPAAAWGASGVSHGLNAQNATNVTIKDMNYSWPVGWSNVGSGGAQIMSFGNCTNVRILNCTSNGGSDHVALIGCANTLVQGCTATNVSNCGYDHWGGTTDARVIGCYVSLDTTQPHGGMCAIAFTGMATGDTPANTAGFICMGNVCHGGVQDSQIISINGHATGGYDNRIIVADNQVYGTPGTAEWGILCTGRVNNVIIHDNYLEANGGALYSAVAAYAPGTNIRIERNVAVNWSAKSSGDCVFVNTAPGGSLVGNTAYGCTTPTTGSVDATTLVAGNDTGTGVYAVARPGVPTVNVINDAAAASAGVVIGGEYRNGSIRMVRVA